MDASRKYFKVENMVRSVSSRVQRQGAPLRHRAATWVLGRRVLPKRPILITPEEFAKNYDTLIAGVQAGEISITKPDGSRIDSRDDGTLVYYAPDGHITAVGSPEPSELETKGTSIEPGDFSKLDELKTEAQPVVVEQPVPVVVTPESAPVVLETVYEDSFVTVGPAYVSFAAEPAAQEVSEPTSSQIVLDASSHEDTSAALAEMQSAYAEKPSTIEEQFQSKKRRRKHE